MTTIQRIEFTRMTSGIMQRICDSQKQIALSGRNMIRYESCIKQTKLLRKLNNTKPRGKAYDRMLKKIWCWR